MKILCIGLVDYDITLPLDGYPEENTKNRLTERIECGGGQTANAACLLAKYGEDVYISGLIGNDFYGNNIICEFNKFNVNTSYLDIDDNYNTSVSHILVNLKNSSRTTLTVKEPHPMRDIDIDIKPDIILVDGQEPLMSKKVFKENPDAIKIIDAGSYREPIISLCNDVDLIIASLDFLEGFYDYKIHTEDELKEAFMAMKKHYDKELIVTIGSLGSMGIIDDEPVLIPSIKVEEKDSTGAGDIFHGAFIYGLIHGLSLKDNLLFSNIAGALSVRKIGARYSFPELNEVKKLYEEHR